MGAARVNLPLAALPGVPEVVEQGWEGAQAGKIPSGSGDPFCAASPEGRAAISSSCGHSLGLSILCFRGQFIPLWLLPRI